MRNITRTLIYYVYNTETKENKNKYDELDTAQSRKRALNNQEGRELYKVKSGWSITK